MNDCCKDPIKKLAARLVEEADAEDASYDETVSAGPRLRELANELLADIGQVSTDYVHRDEVDEAVRDALARVVNSKSDGYIEDRLRREIAEGNVTRNKPPKGSEGV